MENIYIRNYEPIKNHASGKWEKLLYRIQNHDYLLEHYYKQYLEGNKSYLEKIVRLQGDFNRL